MKFLLSFQGVKEGRVGKHNDRGSFKGNRGGRGRGSSRVVGGGGRACWFGSQCKRPDCYYSHPTKTAQPNPSSDQTITKEGPGGTKIINIHM